MKYFILYFLLLLNTLLSGQSKQDYYWLLGYETNLEGNGANGYCFDFNQKAMTIDPLTLPLGFSMNNASICDMEGNLLFYTNGQAVMNREMEIMANGDSINAGRWQELFWANPFRGYPGRQDVLILPDPGDVNGFYLFHKSREYFPTEKDSTRLRWSYIDMNLDAGLGDVSSKNNVVYDKHDILWSYFTAISHKDGKDWWLLQPSLEDSTILTFLLDDQGIHRQEDQSAKVYFDRHRSSSSGTAKFSPDGTKYAIYNYYDQLHVYDFDRSSGKLSNHVQVEIYDPEEIDRNDIRFASVEWSPNSRFIYTASRDDLFQVDSWEEDIHSGVRLIDTFNGTADPFWTVFTLMEQGPDCRIYMAPQSGSKSMHVINKPDELGTACNFVQNGIQLPYHNSGCLPNFPRFRVDEEEKCDPTLVSVFGQTVYYRRNIEVYPNPSSGVFHIVKPEELEEGDLRVMDQNGREIYQTKMGGLPQNTQIDISSFPSGMYLLEIFPEDNTERIFYSAKLNKM